MRANDLNAATDFYQNRFGMKLLTEMYVEKAALTILYYNYGIIRDPDGVKIELLDRPDLRDL